MPEDATPTASESSSKSKLKVGLLSPAYLIEALIVFVAATLTFYLQVFHCGPFLSLLFDSQGYLWITQSCQQLLHRDNLADIIRYFAGACHDDVLRTAIVSHVPGILELQKSGPLLPLILLIAYGVTGKSLMMSHWNVGAMAMVLCLSSCCVGIWAFSRSLGGSVAGRIAAVLAITYGGFLANAGRILTEIPATSISVFALYSVFLYARYQERKRKEMLIQPDDIRKEYAAAQASGEFPSVEQLSEERKKNRFGRKELGLAILSGGFTGMLMLGRPTLLPWPALMCFCLLLVSSLSRNKRILHPAAIAAFLAGVCICLTPWAMTRQVLSGKPSVMIDRYGPLNLSQGMNLRTDGFDALPSPLVQHPEQFDKSMGEVVHGIVNQLTTRPAAVVDLVLRKPARLIDSPWNDFQVKTFGVPILLQRFEHQLILLAAVLGITLLLEHGRKRPDYVLLLTGLLIGVFMCFHLVSCAFISMSRYYITAMPVGIVAASYFFANLLKRGREALIPFAAVIAAPTVSMLLYYLLVPGYGRISDLSCDMGLAPLSVCAGLLMTAVLSCGILVPAFTFYRGGRSKLLLCAFSLITGFCCFITVSHQFMVSEAVIKMGSVDRDKMVASINIPTGSNFNRWYLVIDANDASAHSVPERDVAILSGLQLQANGRDFKADWIPLLNLDRSMREESMYFAVFGYSASKRCSDFRQWIATALPTENILSPGENKFVFSLTPNDKARPKIFADFTDAMGNRIHTVSLRNFSWSKGFFADCPGELRLDEWPKTNNKGLELFSMGGEATHLKPRAYLLGVLEQTPPELWVRSIDVPDQIVDTKNRMGEFAISLAPFMKDLRALSTQSLRIKVSGQLKAKGADSRASIALLENFKQGERTFDEFAPLAPQVLEAKSDWHDFSFEEITQPIRAMDKDGKMLATPIEMDGLRLNFLGRPWWEVLDYGVFKGKGAIEFRNLKVELRSQPSLDLSQTNSHFFELDTEFETR